MPGKKAFTLVEIVTFLIIVGIFTMICVPSYVNYINQGAAQAAYNNLITIYNAQKTAYLNSGASGLYFIAPPGPDTLSNINKNLHLGLIDQNFQYYCYLSEIAGVGIQCTATNASDANVILTATVGIPGNFKSLIAPGGNGCTNIKNAPCNPTCTSDNNSCPN